MPGHAEVVATGIRFAEGPVWCADDDVGRLHERRRRRAVPRRRSGPAHAELVANVGGGANAAQRATDGGFVVTQNGGIDFSKLGLYPDDPPPYRPATPGIQRVDAARRGHLRHRRPLAARRAPRPERPGRRGRRHAVLHRPAAAPAAAREDRTGPRDRVPTERSRPSPAGSSTATASRSSPTAARDRGGAGPAAAPARRHDGVDRRRAHARHRRRLLRRRRGALLRRVDDGPRRRASSSPTAPRSSSSPIRGSRPHDELLLRRVRPPHALRHRRPSPASSSPGRACRPPASRSSRGRWP